MVGYLALESGDCLCNEDKSGVGFALSGERMPAGVQIVGLLVLCAAGWAVPLNTPAAAAETAGSPVTFTKQVLSDEYFCDGVNLGDFNRDGNTDVVAGPFWYAGPRFEDRHEFYPAVPHEPAKSPTNSMFSYVHDFNQDGWQDILVLGRVHLHPAAWYENPQGRPGHWKKHFAFERVQGETPPFADINQDGKPEIICHWENRWGWIQPDWKNPTQPWKFHPVTEPGDYKQFYHGTGVGDVNGDGRNDLILNDGWWEGPPDAQREGVWPSRAFRFAKKGGAQMYAYDVDGDGDNDVITALDAHGWGLAWFEQTRDNGRIGFVQHTIMDDRASEEKYGVAFSQPHALDVADIDGDGLTDVVVGKRRWAHGPQGDVEPNAPPVVYWFQLVRPSGGEVTFRPHLIDAQSGVGLQVVAADVNGDRAPDVLSASKLGCFLFVNRRPERR